MNIFVEDARPVDQTGAGQGTSVQSEAKDLPSASERQVDLSRPRRRLWISTGINGEEVIGLEEPERGLEQRLAVAAENYCVHLDVVCGDKSGVIMCDHNYHMLSGYLEGLHELEAEAKALLQHPKLAFTLELEECDCGELDECVYMLPFPFLRELPRPAGEGWKLVDWTRHGPQWLIYRRPLTPRVRELLKQAA